MLSIIVENIPYISKSPSPPRPPQVRDDKNWLIGNNYCLRDEYGLGFKPNGENFDFDWFY